MPRSRRQNVRQPRSDSPMETIAKIDAMEENLRRLGLRNETSAASGRVLHAGGLQNYMASIRKAKEEAVKLRHEKEYRLFAAEEQKRENEMMLSYVSREKDLRDVITKAKSLIEQETKSAHEAVLIRAQKSTDKFIREEELQRQSILRDRVYRAKKESFEESSVVRPTIVTAKEEERVRRKDMKPNAIRDYCHIMASGIVELAMRVADNVFTIGQPNDEPVLRIPRDITVSQWSAWVNELIFSKTVVKPMSDVLATTSLRELCDANYKSHSNQKEEGLFSSQCGSDSGKHGVSEATQKAPPCSDSHGVATSVLAEYVLQRLVEMQSAYETKLIDRSVNDAIQLIKKHEKRKLFMQLEEIRRQHESQCPEEVAPGWTHRLPPVGCFLQGDELSGLKMFVDVTCGEAANEAPLVLPVHKRRCSVTALSETTKTAVENDVSKWENEPYRVLTPLMLVRTAQNPFAGQGGGGGGGGTGSGSLFAMAGGKSAKGGVSPASNSSRGRDGRQAEEILDSKQYIDALCDVLSKELAAVYQHNLQLLIRSTGLLSESKSAGRGVMHTLFLVGFPETELFLRTLYQKLHIAVEFVEQEITRALKAEEAAEESTNQQLGGKGKSSQRGGTVSPEDGAGLRTKALRSTPPNAGKRGGGAGRLPAAWNEEENIPGQLRVYPPLSLVGIFLQYDVPSRRRRMQEASEFLMSSVTADPRTLKTTMLPDEGNGGSYGDWTIKKLRHELIQQDKKMRRSWKTWCSNVSKSCVLPDPDLVRATSAEGKKKRSRLSLQNKITEQQPASPSTVFPKVLFFWRKEDITHSLESTTPAEAITAIVKGVVNPTLQCVTRNDRLVPGQLISPWKLGDYRFPPSALTELAGVQQHFQALWREHNQTCMNVTMTTTTTATTTTTTAAHQKTIQKEQLTSLSQSPPPTSTSTATAVPMPAARAPTASSAPSPPSPSSPNCLTAKNSMCSKKHDVKVESMVVLESEMYRVYRIFFSDMLQFINQNVFPPSLWGSPQSHPDCNLDTNPGNDAEMFSRTLYFISLDENYDNSRDALCTLLVDGMSKLTAISALLFYSVLDLALKSMGEALTRLCSWVCEHIDNMPPAMQSGMVKFPVPSTKNSITNSSSTTMKEELVEVREEDVGKIMNEEKTSSTTSKCNTSPDDVMKSFLESVPRLSFEEIQTMIGKLDGNEASFSEFQKHIWSYASRVHNVMLELFLTFVKTLVVDLKNWSVKALEEVASQVTEVIVAYLFAFSPSLSSACKEDLFSFSSGRGGSLFKFLTASGISGPSMSVSVSRAMASIRALRRCSTVASICAARWVDAMYATALTVPPHGSFPAYCRPTDIPSVFCPPTIVANEGCAPPPSLARQLITSRFPAFCLTTDEECDCWWETEMEVILQVFSIYQKPALNEAEFLHCIMHLQLNSLWKYLPVKRDAIAKQLGISDSFLLRPPEERDNDFDRKEYEEMEEEERSVNRNFRFPWLRSVPCYAKLNDSFLTEENGSRLFHLAVKSQQQVCSDCTSPAKAESPAFSLTVGTEMDTRKRHLKKPLLGVREFFISLMLRRLCLSEDLDGGSGGVAACPFHGDGFQEPSTMQLRQMIKSLPRSVREQSPNSIPTCEPVSMEEWKAIKWWPFYEEKDGSLSKTAEFVRRYLLRLLTVCFNFVNGELCSRRIPFLPDILYTAAGARGCQATLGRYFHALYALNVSRENKLTHSEDMNAMSVSASTRSNNEDPGPLVVFDFPLTVDETMFFFQHVGEANLSDAGQRGMNSASSAHLCELRDIASTTEESRDGEISAMTVMTAKEKEEKEEEVKKNVDNNNNNTINNSDGIDDEDDEDALPLATELTLLLEIEKSPAVTLTLLGSSHWGAYIIPRLTAVPFQQSAGAPAAVKRGAELAGILESGEFFTAEC